MGDVTGIDGGRDDLPLLGPSESAAVAGVAAQIQALPPQDSARLHAAVARLSQPLLTDGEVRSQMTAHLATARR